MLRITSHDGLSLAAEERGSGVSALLVHANGFCKEMWRPVADRVQGIRAVAVDQRGHGDSAAGPFPFDWWDLGGDVDGWAAALPFPRIGVGHSSGGAALVMGEILAPGTWNHLVLVEPIIYPGPFERAESHPLVTGALRRRVSFASRADTRAAYAGRGPFAGWTAEALDLYIEYGFRDGPGGERHLACAPATEAEYYRMATAHGAWERLGEVACPVTLLAGEHSDSHPPDFAARLTSRFRHGTLITVPGAGHFIPMERPAEVADVVAQVRQALSLEP
ncbi:MAG TPA: alpha/beta hydrolase [Actinobacteria bacterium]|nr:alpha/beta hydrolase [Actinomycetota bacterium]